MQEVHTLLHVLLQNYMMCVCGSYYSSVTSIRKGFEPSQTLQFTQFRVCIEMIPLVMKTQYLFSHSSLTRIWIWVPLHRGKQLIRQLNAPVFPVHMA